MYEEPAPENRALPCLVYVHGFTSNQLGDKAQYFRAQAKRRGLAWCSFDFRGHGTSSGSMLDLTMERNIDDLRRVADWLAEKGHERLVLIGSSMGGYTSIWFATQFPERVAAACHIAPAFEMARGFLLWAEPERTEQWEREGSIRFENDFLCTRLGWEWIADLKTRDDTVLHENYRTPTLILQGKQDELVPWRSVAAFVSKCRYDQIDLHLFADGDHRLTDRKERLWALMLEFLVGRGILPR